MAALLTRWRGLVIDQATPGEPDSAAQVSWPSRDPVMTRLFLSSGLAPVSVVAARPAGRQVPAGGPDLPVRRLRESDLGHAVGLWLEVVRWDAQFGAVNERPSTADRIREELVDELGRANPWTWVAEVDGRVAGLLMISPPARSGWIAPVVKGSATAYLGCLGVSAGRRGRGGGRRPGPARPRRSGRRRGRRHVAALRRAEPAVRAVLAPVRVPAAVDGLAGSTCLPPGCRERRPMTVR
jgi:hypothetical protein